MQTFVNITLTEYTGGRSPFAIYFVYTPNGRFVVRGMSDMVRKYIGRTFPKAVFHASFYLSGKRRGEWGSTHSILIDKNRLGKQRKNVIFIHNQDGTIKTLTVRRVPHRWLPEYDLARPMPNGGRPDEGLGDPPSYNISGSIAARRYTINRQKPATGKKKTLPKIAKAIINEMAASSPAGGYVLNQPYADDGEVPAPSISDSDPAAVSPSGGVEWDSLQPVAIRGRRSSAPVWMRDNSLVD